MGEISDRLHGESDRGAVLVAQAAIDEAVEALIRTVLVHLSLKHIAFGELIAKHFDENIKHTDAADAIEGSISRLFDSARGPLATSWAKIEAANALGLLTPAIYMDLGVIRLLRNHFAHTKDKVDFLDDKVVTRVRSLSTFSAYASKMKRRYSLSSPGKTRPSDATIEEMGFMKFSKGAFAYAVECIVGYLSLMNNNFDFKK